MTRDFERLARETFDVLVIGGGIYGLTIAYDAALRGLSVALVERGDFGGRTSFNHHKTLHGGLRYLQTGDLTRMRESVSERRTFALIAPQFIAPQPFLMPTRRSLTRGRWAMRVAFALDRVVAFDRNRDVPDSLRLPAGRVVSVQELRRLAPEVELDGPTGAALWFDYRTIESERLTFAFALAAARQGAVLVNYAEAVIPTRDGSRVAGMQVRDLVTGESCLARARTTCNAAGAAAGRIMAGFGVRRSFPLLKAMNVVTRRPAAAAGLGVPTSEGRILVALPWRGRLAIGTWHARELSSADASGVGPDELDEFLAEINSAFGGLRLCRDDVTMVQWGVVPAKVMEGRPPALLDHGAIYDHERDGISGAISAVGVKYTTARLMAERVVDLTIRRLGRRPIQSRSSEARLVPGPELYEPSAVERLRDLVRTRPDLGRALGGGAVIGAHVIEAVREEMALTLEDVVMRRTALGSSGYPGDEPVRAAAGLMQSELQWSAERVEDEVEAVRRFFGVRGSDLDSCAIVHFRERPV
jgi:glycerol-3-phosphate dehydrogenase